MAVSTHPLWFRLLRGILVAVFSLVLLLGLASWWLMGTPSGMRWLLGTALPYAQAHLPEESRLDIEGIDADTLADVRIARLTLSDTEGVWFEAERLALSWMPYSLWHGVLEAQEISAGRMRFIRMPISTEPPRSMQEQAEDIAAMLEELPNTMRHLSLPPLRIQSLHVAELVMEDAFLDVPSRFAFGGSMDLTISPARLALDLHSLEGIATQAGAHISGTADDVTLAIHWKEDTGGLLGHMLQLAEPAPLNWEVDAQLQQRNLTARLKAQAGDSSLAEADIHTILRKGETVQWQARLPQPRLFAPLSDFPAAIEAAGQFDEDTLHMRVNSERIASLHHAAAEAALHLNRKEAPLMLEAQANAEMPQDGQPALPLQLALHAQGDAEAWDMTSLTIRMGDMMDTQASGSLHLTDGNAAVKGVLSLPQLDLHYQAKATDLWDSMQAQAEVTLKTPLKQPLPAPLDAIVTLPLTLRAETTGHSSGASLPDVDLVLESEHIRGSGAFYPAAGDDSPLALGQITVEGLPVPLTLSARHMPAGNGEVELRSEGMVLTAYYMLGEDRLQLPRILLDAGKELRLEGNASVNTASGLVSGRLTGQLLSTAPFSRLGFDLPDISAGEGQLDITANAVADGQEAVLTFDSRSVRIDGTAAIGQARLEAALRPDKGKTSPLSAAFSVKDMTYPFTVEEGKIEAHGPSAEKLAISMDVKNESTKTYVSVTQLLLEMGESITLTSEGTAYASWQDNRLNLSKGFTAIYGSDEIALRGLRLGLNGDASKSASADFSLRKDRVNGEMELSSIPLSALPAGMFGGMKGVLNGRLTLSGAAANPDARLEMTIQELQHNYPAMTRLHHLPLAVELNTTLARQALSVRLTADAPDEKSSAAVSLDTPVDASLAPDALRFAIKGPVDARARADLILGPFLPLFLPDGIYGTGHLIADLSLRGKLESPSIHGSVDLYSGRLEVLQTGTTVDNLTFKAKASGNRIDVTDGSATDGGKGKLAFHGSMRLTPTLPMDIAAEVQKFVVMRHTNATATLSGDASLKGSLDKALLKGDWKVDDARIIIQNGGSNDIPELRVVEVSSLDDPIESPEKLEMTAAEREAAREKLRKERPFARKLAMQIAIAAANQIFLEGFGLNAELKGKVDISGTAARPKLGGQMETVRGRWEFFGKTFTITRGKALLSENNLTAPLIDIRAETQAAEITAIAQITGTTDNPVIEFSSIPPLPKDEILSRVMFGTRLNSISPYQALLLADMLRSLSGGGGSINPLSKLQHTLGIDELKIGGSGTSEDVTVGVGKYLRENIYLEVESGSTEDSGKVSVEVDLTPHISVETETRQNAESAVRLNYKYDY